MMKVFIAVVAVGLALVFAEPPPSNSYLPPPPAGRGSNQPQGYSSGRPEVVAARSLGGSGQSGLTRKSLAGAGPFGGLIFIGFPRNGPAAFGGIGGSAEAGYDVNGAAFGRNALQDGSSETASYNFGYMVNDNFEGTDFGHHEERYHEKAQGQYHVVLPDGRKQTVRYEADERGFKPRVSYEDAEDVSNSNGYDSNVNGIGGNGGGGGYKNGGGGRGNGYNNGGARSSGY